MTVKKEVIESKKEELESLLSDIGFKVFEIKDWGYIPILTVVFEEYSHIHFEELMMLENHGYTLINIYHYSTTLELDFSLEKCCK